MEKKFLPELREATANFEVEASNALDLWNIASAFVLKLCDAFLYQEYLIYLPFAYDNFGLSFGAAFAIIFSWCTDLISGHGPKNTNITIQKEIYPGETECRTYSPHGLFHELAASAFPTLF